MAAAASQLRPAAFVGALLAVLWVRRRTPTRGLIPVAWIALGVRVLSVEFVRGDSSFYFDGGSTLFAVAIAALILATLESNWPVNRLLCLAPLRAVGRVSYGLYLWHYPVFWVVARYGARWPFPVPAVVGHRRGNSHGAVVGARGAAGIALEAPTAQVPRRREMRGRRGSRERGREHRAVETANRRAAVRRGLGSPCLGLPPTGGA